MGHKHSEMAKGLSDTRDGFVFLAGHIALDLPSTKVARLKPSPRELLSSPSDLGRWLIAAELTDTVPEVTQADLAVARDLRESIYSLALACIHREALPNGSRREINQLALETAAVPQLDEAGLFRLAGSTRGLLGSLARDAIILFGSETKVRIRQCEGETCARLFLDTSRSGDRRWCSMLACGNKAKVADFRRRKREES